MSWFSFNTNDFAYSFLSVLFEGVRIGRYAKIRRAIIDKDVEIPPYMEIGYDREADRRRFFVTDKVFVVIPKRAKLEAPPAPPSRKLI